MITFLQCWSVSNIGPFAPGKIRLQHPPDQENLTPSQVDVSVRAKTILDETHRELAWIRSALVAGFYLVLSTYNFFYLEPEARLTATAFSLVVVVSFALFTAFHRFVDYPARQTNLVTMLKAIPSACSTHISTNVTRLVWRAG